MFEITVVSLGPGSREYLTLGAVEKMEKASKLILRTGSCDASLYLKEKGIVFDTLDQLHETSEDFDELVDNCTEAVIRASALSDVCYAVLDAEHDETVKRLRSRTKVRQIAGVSCASPLLAAAAQDKTEIQTASSLEITGTQNALLMLECDSVMLMGECKLQLLEWYSPDQPVYFFPPCEKPERDYIEIPLEDLDRQKKYDHTCCCMIPPLPLRGKKRFDFYDLVRVVDILRGPDGCPWDKAQTHQSLTRYLLEESYEAAEQIAVEDWDAAADELGDVLLQVVLHARIGKEFGDITLSDITSDICDKMIKRHRHVFGSDDCKTVDEVLDNWEKIKKEERGQTTQADVLRNVSHALPALLRADKVQGKARDVGFDWDDPMDALQKVHEEADEVRLAIEKGDPDNLREELGDLLFSCVNAARLCKEDSEKVLTMATEKFIKRFTRMENAILADGKQMKHLTLSEMDVYWNSSKRER